MAKKNTKTINSSVELSRAMIENIVSAVSAFAIESGQEPQEITEALNNCIARIKKRKVKSVSDREHLDGLADAIYVWTHNPLFLAHDGTPKPLVARGKKNSIESLLRQTTGACSESSLQTFLKSKSIRKTAENKFAPCKSYLDIAHDRSLLAYYACLTAMRFLDTAAKNIATGPRRTNLIERTTAVTDLPIGNEEAFKAFCKSQGEGLIQNVCKWLQNRKKLGTRAKAAKAGGSVEAGIHVFSFVRPAPTV